MSSIFETLVSDVQKANSAVGVALGHLGQVETIGEDVLAAIPGGAPLAALIPVAGGIITGLQSALNSVLNSPTSTVGDVQAATSNLTGAVLNTILAVSPLVKTVANDASAINVSAISGANVAAAAVMALGQVLPTPTPAAAAATPA